MKYYKVRRKSDGKFLGRKPKFHKERYYFGREGHVYPGSKAHIRQAVKDLRASGYDVEVLEYQLVEARLCDEFILTMDM